PPPAPARGPWAAPRPSWLGRSGARPPVPGRDPGQLHAVGWGGVSAEHVESRPGAYADSVTLMQASTDVRKADEVEAALIAMATELNLGLLAEMGFAVPPQAGPND